ncbi:MAG: HAMP domain-containing sensor histidine kinase [Syntrophobacterales bacterium]|jgi:signal transduction histidine kinase
MNNDAMKPVLLKPAAPAQQVGPLLLWGLLLGAVVGLLVVHPISMLVRAAHDAIYSGVPLELIPAFIQSYRAEMWPMMLLYTLLGALVGAVLGIVLKLLKEHRQRLDAVHQEFELQVATLRHHYKNLAIGIQGFSGRVRRKLGDLEKQLHQCDIENSSVNQEFAALDRNVGFLEEASQRLTQTLGQELMFLKALTSESMVSGTTDIYPLLIHSIQDLLDFRFRDKHLQVEINGEPWERCRESLVFAFEPYALEVILQNLLSNSMKFGDHIQVKVSESDGWVQLGIRDNGPGLEVGKLKDHLLAPADRHAPESTHLGLKVSLRLINKSGGHLFVRSQPGSGAEFMVELPKQPVVKA